MKTQITLSVGLALGSAFYDLVTKGIDGVDFYKTAFIAAFSFIVLLFLPKRLLDKKPTDTN